MENGENAILLRASGRSLGRRNLFGVTFGIGVFCIRFDRLMKRNQYHRTKDNRMRYEWILREHQVTAELVVMDPNDA